MDVERADISRVLTEMRAIRSQVMSDQLATPKLPSGLANVKETEKIPAFSDMMTTAINGTNETLQNASSLSAAFERGDADVDITKVMVSLQKANVSFQAMNQVRNRLISAYQDIMNMPI